MDALVQRQDTLPEYMMDEILQGLNTYGAKELLEQELGVHISNRDKAWNKLNLFYKNDTANYSSARDSLIVLHQNENRLFVKYNLAFMYLSQDDSSSVFNTLDNIPLEFDLTEEASTIHNLYLDLFEILWQTRKDTVDLDSIQIESLFDIASMYHTIPGIYASNILIKEGYLSYYEPVYLIEPLKTDPISDKKPALITKSRHLKVFPNPAGNYFIAEYNLTDFDNRGILSICDVHGKGLKVIHLKDKINQIVIPVIDLSPGLYIIKLYSGFSMIDLQKITITQ